MTMAYQATTIATSAGTFAYGGAQGVKAIYDYFSGPAQEEVPEAVREMTLDQAKQAVQEMRNDLDQPYNTKEMYEGAVKGVCLQLGRNIAGTQNAGTHAQEMRDFMRPDVVCGNITQDGWAYIYQVLSNPPPEERRI